MFDLQSLCSNQSQPDWISTGNSYQLEQTAKSIEYLWSKRNFITYPQSNVNIDSTQPLYCDLNVNTYINSSTTENIIRFNDLLPPLHTSGEISNLSPYNLSTFIPKNTLFNIQNIQIHIQFTDRSYDTIQNTLKKSRDHDKYLSIKRKKRRFHELSNNKNIRQSKRIRNKLHREIFDFDNNNNNTNINNNNNNNNNDNNSDTNDNDSDNIPILQLPDLEPTNTNTNANINTNINKKGPSIDSVSSMSISPEIVNKKKRKLNEINKPRKKRKLITNQKIESDVIGDSEDSNDNINSEYDEFDNEILNSFIYEITLDDLQFDFFLSLFPQLYMTHNLIYCMNTFKHYYYQNYFSSKDNQYEWIQTDKQLIDIYNRYINNMYNIKNHYKNKKIILFFQIRPRSDTKSDNKQIKFHKQLLLNNLMQINQFKKNGQLYVNNENINNNNNTIEIFDMESETDIDFDFDMDINTDSSSYNQDMLISNVIKAIHDTNNDSNNNEEDNDIDNILIAGTYESGLCGFCEKKFSTNKCSQEEWIECEFCHKWYHVVCSGLTNKDFLKFQSKNNDENNKYKCLMCITNKEL